MSSNCSVQSLNLYEIKSILFSSQWIKREEKRQLGNALNMNAVYYFFSEDAKYSLQLKIWVESMSLQDAFKVSQTFTLSSQDLKKSLGCRAQELTLWGSGSRSDDRPWMYRKHFPQGQEWEPIWGDGYAFHNSGIKICTCTKTSPTDTLHTINVWKLKGVL